MRVYLGADHAGFEMKNVIAKYLTDAGHEVIDCGAHDYDHEDTQHSASKRRIAQ